jgi:hypothetical protein
VNAYGDNSALGQAALNTDNSRLQAQAIEKITQLAAGTGTASERAADPNYQLALASQARIDNYKTPTYSAKPESFVGSTVLGYTYATLVGGPSVILSAVTGDPSYREAAFETASKIQATTAFTAQVGVGSNAAPPGGSLLGWYGETGVAFGVNDSGISVHTYSVNGYVFGPQQGASIGVVGSLSQGTPTVGDTTLTGVTAFGGAGAVGNVTVMRDQEGNLGVGRASVRAAVGEAVGVGGIRAQQTINPPLLTIKIPR